MRPCARVHRPGADLAFGAHELRVLALDLPRNRSRATIHRFNVVGHWDAALDFERAPRPSNPSRDRYGNSTWFYLYSQGAGHDPAAYAPLPDFNLASPGWEVWQIAGFFGATVGVLDQRAFMHPNPGQNAIIGWRAPFAATFKLRATISTAPQEGCPAPANGIVWSLDQGQRTLRTAVLGPGLGESLESIPALAAGEFLYLVVTDNGDPSCDSTTVQLTVEMMPA
jgi:hypothetical protein